MLKKQLSDRDEAIALQKIDNLAVGRSQRIDDA